MKKILGLLVTAFMLTAWPPTSIRLKSARRSARRRKRMARSCCMKRPTGGAKR